MVNEYYGIADLKNTAAGAAILASGGGASYLDAVNIIREFEATGWSGAIPVQEYDGATNCCVLAMAAPALCKTPGVVASFAGLLRNIGYAGALPYPQSLESGI
jgi:hypothetical protein